MRSLPRHLDPGQSSRFRRRRQSRRPPRLDGAGRRAQFRAMSDHGAIAANLAAVEARIAAAAHAAGRVGDAVALVAVSKTHPADAVAAALAAGQRRFGENRVQEAEAKYPALKERVPALELHLIGPLQTNKARAAVALFDVIETVDRLRLAAALAREMERGGRRLPCLIEVNTGAEKQKAGILPAGADAFIAECRGPLGLAVAGLMCIPPEHDDPAPHFALLREIARRNGLAQLSMGMSADFETAIRFGATSVRIGTAVFGPRRTPA
jgi:PLP dependent protein